VIERSQELSFPEKAVAPRRAVPAGEQLYCYPLLNLAIRTFGEINSSHSSCAKNAYGPIGSLMDCHAVMIELQCLFRRVDDSLRDAVVTRRIEVQKRFYFGSQLRIDLAFRKESFTLAARQVGNFLEENGHGRLDIKSNNQMKCRGL
jgi:hypothetical protein